MPLPAGNPQTKLWFDTLMNDAINLQSYCLLVQQGTVGGAAISCNAVMSVADACITFVNDVATISLPANASLVTQLIPYFQQQLGAPAFRADVEFPTLNTLAQNILNAFALDYPHNAQNVLLDRSYNFSVGRVWVTLTAAQMSHIMPAIAAYLAEIVA